jgi:hypothetical protein
VWFLTSLTVFGWIVFHSLPPFVRKLPYISISHIVYQQSNACPWIIAQFRPTTDLFLISRDILKLRTRSHRLTLAIFENVFTQLILNFSWVHWIKSQLRDRLEFPGIVYSWIIIVSDKHVNGVSWTSPRAPLSVFFMTLPSPIASVAAAAAAANAKDGACISNRVKLSDVRAMGHVNRPWRAQVAEIHRDANADVVVQIVKHRFWK